ncbi:hypothetical protein AOE55_02515 [Candidatus Riesia pediculicola]|nr:hypothetical protein AOE55_02515 [Candidatus Riesia pediculicola]
MSFSNEKSSMIQKKLQMNGVNVQSEINIDQSLKHLSQEYAKMFSKSGYNHFPKIDLMKNDTRSDQMIMINNIQFISFCEHHLLVIDGFSTVAYIPKKYIVGFSKISQIVHFFSKRPQLQERLTRQILISLKTILDIEDVAVFVRAVHYCMKLKTQDGSSDVITTELSGSFLSNHSLKNNFFRSCYSFNKGG